MDLDVMLPEPRLLRHWLPDVEEHLKRRGSTPDFPINSLPSLNRQPLYGIYKGGLTVIAARTSQGKSAFSSQITVDLANQGFKVMSFQLEMSAVETVKRMFCYRMEVDSGKILKGAYNLDPQIRQQFNTFSKEMGNKIILLSENFGKTWSEIIEKVEACPTPPDVILIDHLGNIKSDPRNQRENINEYVRQFRALCVQKNIAGILCAQLNRTAVEKDSESPSLAHLKESGYIEEAADVCALLWWPFKAGRQLPEKGIRINGIDYRLTEEEWKQFFIFDVAKNRNGACGKVPLRFEPHIYKFSDWTSNALSQSGRLRSDLE